MQKINFNLRDKNSKKETPINLIVRWDGKRAVLSTGLRVLPKQWNNTKQRKKNNPIPKGFHLSQLDEEERKTHDATNTFNSNLDRIETKIVDIFNNYRYSQKQEVKSVKELKQLFNPKLKEKKGYALLNFYEFYNEYLNFKDYTYQTEKWYTNTYNQLKEYKPNLEFEDIDLSFHKGFNNFLKNKDYYKNTIAKHIGNLKAVLNSATYHGANTNLAFQSREFKKEIEETKNIYLKDDEVNQIYNLDLSDNPRLERVRDLFIVGCRTGLRFSDFKDIHPDSFDDSFITVFTSKNDTEVVIPIHPMVKEIRKKYKGQTANNLPPPISNQKLNDYIKEVCALIPSLNETYSKRVTKGGEKKIISKKKYLFCGSHTARRTFASIEYRYKSPMVTIMSITGHKTTQSFLKYIKISSEEHAQILKEIWEEQLEKRRLNQ